MKATDKNSLTVTTTKGTAVEVRWPSCHEPMLANAVDFCIGRKSTTRFIDTLYAKNAIERIFWGSPLKPFQLWEDHRLSVATMRRVREWLETREMPADAIAMPDLLKDLREATNGFKNIPADFPETPQGLRSLLLKLKKREKKH